MSGLFDLRNTEYNLRSQTDFSFGAVYATNYGLRSLRYCAPITGNMIPADIRNVNNFSDFILKIAIWIPDGCPGNLCIACICQVGYIN